MGTKREYTIQRPDGRSERTIVGKTGQEYRYPNPTNKHGKDGHFTDEGQYRRAIEKAVAENKQ